MSLLRRLSLSLQRAPEEPRALPRGTSFNDLSLGAADDHHAETGPLGAQAGVRLASVSVPSSPHVPAQTPFGSAPTGGSVFPKSPALSIPRTSVAHLLEQRLKAAESGTPRSSLDLNPGSVSSPHASLSSLSSPMTPRAPASSDASEPPSPRSPRTPGGRRRKSQKIDGLDYWDYCELIRASSL